VSDSRKKIVLTIEDENVLDLRLDRFIAENLKLFPRSQISNHNLSVEVNNKPAKLSRKVAAGDYVEITYTTLEPVSYAPEQMELNILFENQDVIVVNKAQGMVVHPAAGNRSGTLVQGLLYHCKELRETFEGDELRPGIVHRLDKATSGVLIAAKHPRAQDQLASQFRRKKTIKKYYAIVKGRIIHPEDTVETYITRDRRNRKRFTVSDRDGKLSVTKYRLIKTWESYSFLALMPVTGRTHQLRVHMKYLNHPIVGDPAYGRKDSDLPDATLMLHAYSLSIKLPGEDTPRTFRAPLPPRFKETLLTINDLQMPD
jgi:23S rRNA pseudouridine1911/1915/1917 synthase